MSIKALVISGDFTPEEFAAFVAQMRQIDDQSPERVFKIERFDEDMEQLRETLRQEPGRNTLMASFRLR